MWFKVLQEATKGDNKMLSGPLLPSVLQHKFVKVYSMFKDCLNLPLLLGAGDLGKQEDLL